MVISITYRNKIWRNNGHVFSRKRKTLRYRLASKTATRFLTGVSNVVFWPAAKEEWREERNCEISWAVEISFAGIRGPKMPPFKPFQNYSYQEIETRSSQLFHVFIICRYTSRAFLGTIVLSHQDCSLWSAIKVQPNRIHWCVQHWL